jgi:putative SOS response-associated peptidase YedK
LAPSSRSRYARAMCGRVRLSSDVSEIKLVFSIPPHRPTPNIAPSWNVAPTDPLPVVRYDAKDRQRSLDVDNFYEWKKTATGKQPYAIALAEGGLMALAGLWENWRSPAGEWVRSFAIITITPNELCAELHNRMPVVLKPEAWPVWPGEEAADPSELKSVLTPFPSEQMTCWPVSARVGNVKNNDPGLIEPIAA